MIYTPTMYSFSSLVIRIGLGLAALPASVVVLQSPPAAACSCDAGRQVRWLKEGDQPLPRNAQLRVRMGRDGVAVPWSLPGQTLPRPAELRLALVDKQSGGEVAVAERRVDAGWGLMALLSPKAPLRPGAQYQVVVAQDKQRATLGEFRTSAVEDRSAPAFAGVESAHYTPPVVPPPNGGLCDSGREHVELKLTPLRDDQAGSALYLVWLSNDGSRIDFTAPPRHAQLLRPSDRTLQVGSSSKCNAEGLSWAARPGQTELHVGLVAYDEAGNASPPTERVIPLGAPAKP